VRRIEVCLKDRIRQSIEDKLRKNRTLTEGGEFSLLKGCGIASEHAVGTPLSNKWATNPSISSVVKATG
jgi:hypothetical protein